MALPIAVRLSAWIYYIEIVPAHRGSGAGRALLRAVEFQLRQGGFDLVGLNVSVDNVVARNLYESSGYEVSSLAMRKVLRESDGDMVSDHRSS